MLKDCVICGKPFDARGKAKACSPDHRAEMIREQNRRWREANPDKVSEQNRRHYKAHAEERSSRSRRYYEAHAEEIRERARLYYEAHAEEVRPVVRRYQEAHAEEISLRKRRYYEAHAEEISDRTRRHYEAHAEEISDRTRRWAKANPEKVAKYKRFWAKANPEKVAAVLRRRRARKAAAPGTFTAEDWRALVAHSPRCHWCKKSFTSKRRPTHDHVIPLSKGGADDISNSCCACKGCNSGKCDRLINPANGEGILL
jgi:hypothetical protein